MEVTTSEVPAILIHNGSIYGPIVDKIVALPKGKSLKIVCKDEPERARVLHGIADHRLKRKIQFRIYREENTIWCWNELKQTI